MGVSFCDTGTMPSGNIAAKETSPKRTSRKTSIAKKTGVMRKASTSGTTTRLPRKQIRSAGRKKAVAVTPWYLLMPTMTRGPTGPLKMVLEHHGHMLSEILCCVNSPVVLGMAAQTCRGWRVAGEMAAQKLIGLMIHHYNVPAQMEESAIATWMQVLRPSLFVDAALMKAANLETPLL